MKTTLEIDEALLERVMSLTGVKTRRAAVDYALREAEKGAAIARLVREAPDDYLFGDCLAEGYDPLSVREKEIPRT